MKYVWIMYGAGGRAYSAGMEDKLAARVRTISGTMCPPTRPYEKWKEIVEGIRAHLDDKHIIIGHSLGAAACTWIANQGYPIDLLVGYDPTMWSRKTVPATVKRVIEFHGHSWVNPFGLNLLKSGYKGHFEFHSSGDAHIAFDDDLKLHAITLGAIVPL